ncbi:hypothetical protein ANO14919_104990 [Xylariales sp. No.14919]|nr:hypothetical protein ANO14919_104990 [Xylariales sp. No.14919]
MGKAKTSKRNAGSGPYERPSKNNAATNNVFKFTKDLGQHILRNPGIAQASLFETNGRRTGDRTRNWKSHSSDLKSSEKSHCGRNGPQNGRRSDETSSRQARTQTP